VTPDVAQLGRVLVEQLQLTAGRAEVSSTRRWWSCVAASATRFATAARVPGSSN
jgi:hypothetical protein